MKDAFSRLNPDVSGPRQSEHAELEPVREDNGAPTEPPQMPRPEESVDRDVKGKWRFDDDLWDVFIPDEDELDPLPEPGDFWIEPDE